MKYQEVAEVDRTKQAYSISREGWQRELMEASESSLAARHVN
jgi:hypothetical protein